jgi:hypothetical protein
MVLAASVAQFVKLPDLRMIVAKEVRHGHFLHPMHLSNQANRGPYNLERNLLVNRIKMSKYFFGVARLGNTPRQKW